tara:strand:- start:727 stop:1221 length:495 start_codon:yes stop_codon:yes gene_type:complete
MDELTRLQMYAFKEGGPIVNLVHATGLISYLDSIGSIKTTLLIHLGETSTETQYRLTLDDKFIGNLSINIDGSGEYPNCHSIVYTGKIPFGRKIRNYTLAAVPKNLYRGDKIPGFILEKLNSNAPRNTRLNPLYRERGQSVKIQLARSEICWTGDQVTKRDIYW